MNDQPKSVAFERDPSTATDGVTSEITAPVRRSPLSMLISVFRWFCVLALVSGVVLFGWHWWQDRQAYIYVQDARIASDMITLSAGVAGHLTELNVNTGTRVDAGKVLARLDAREIDLRIGEAQSQLASLQARRIRVLAQRKLATAQTASRIEMAKATIAMTEADARAATATELRHASELQRAEQLFKRKVISSQQVEDAHSAFATAAERRRQTQAAVTQAKAAMTAAEVEREQVAVLDAELGVLDAERAILQTRGEQLRVQREQREITANAEAIVDRTFVELGEYLRVGTRIVMLHDPNNIWIAANVKETELQRFAVGAEVRAVVDAYPDLNLRGSVTWVGPAATSLFALLPNANPSGNFTKVTQRVPVRIDLLPSNTILRPGMMVEVAIDATHN